MHYALTEEVYFKNHQALGYMTPPFSFPASKAPMIEAWINDYMGKLSDLGYRYPYRIGPPNILRVRSWRDIFCFM